MAKLASPIWLNNSMGCKTAKPKEKGSKTIDRATEELLEQACKNYKLGVYKTVKAAADAYKVSSLTLV